MFQEKRWMVLALLCFVILFSTPSFAQEDAAAQTMTVPVSAQESADEDVIETEVSSDNLIEADEQDESAMQEQDANELSEQEKQFIRINQSLKNIIDENQKLSKQRDDLQKDIEALRGERMVQETRLRALANERANILKKSQEIDNSKASYEKEIEGLKKELESAKKKVPEEILIEESQTVLGEGDEAMAQPGLADATLGKPKSIAVMRGSEEMAKEMGKLVEENQILRKDTIKLHYNLANLFFEQGKYEMAALEYNRVLDLMPQDAATHYNLAFVSAEYLRDYKTAITHYKKYLALDPSASDAPFVKTQILELQLKMQNKIDSIVDRDKGEVDLPLK
jgi:tetratricopeptide (TPR) repeat protein